MKRFTALVVFSLLSAISPAVSAGQAASATPAPAHKSATSTPRKTMTTDSALLHPSTLTAKSPDSYQVKFVTTKGDFIVQVTRSWAPLGSDRFYNLVKHGFFTDAAFFRVVPGFIIQFGLSANPAVSRVWQNANIKDDPVTQSNKPGYLTFATAGPNTRTTQLFINFGNNTFLDNQGFAPFGQVVSGMEVVQSLYSGYGEKPDQNSITTEGKAYLDKSFPNLDSIKSATVVTPAAAPK
jgi:peptidyl-prolyl cis-trans isomerase A (cyclophilin A)